jgi:hypothetical protein
LVLAISSIRLRFAEIKACIALQKLLWAPAIRRDYHTTVFSARLFANPKGTTKPYQCIVARLAINISGQRIVINLLQKRNTKT